MLNDREAEEYLIFGHNQAHNAPRDPDKTMQFAFMEADLWLTAVALALVPRAFPCLIEESIHLQRLLKEVFLAQEPWWPTIQEDEQEEDELSEGEGF